MAFDHEKLDVYHRALEALATCDRIGPCLPTGRAKVRDPIDRAAPSVVANIAEGAGEFSSPEKARFYRMARRSAVEVVAWLDICRHRGDPDSTAISAAFGQYEVVVSMLVRLIQAHHPNKRGQGHSQGHSQGAGY